MPRSSVRSLLILTAFGAATLLQLALATTSQAEGYRQARRVYKGDLFYNYYVGPAQYAGGAVAQMYPSPLPTPPLVGHTYVTYPPLMPHEFLYKHNRIYYRHNPGEGWVQTKVRYR